MSSYQEATGRSIQADFETYHNDHPKIYEMFKRFTKEIVISKRSNGVKDDNIKTSSKMILNRIRWEITNIGIDVKNVEDNVINKQFDQFKINDAFTSRYARLFMHEYPTWQHLFNVRELRS